MASVTYDHVTKRYTSDVAAVNDLSIQVRDTEFMVLVGPSGCGKSTALRMLAGLEEITEGEIKIGERTVNEVPARERDIAMVFQSYALYPHMSVYDNMAFGLKMRGTAKPEIQSKVGHAARMLGLDQFLQRKPRQLSGGQRQRVALGRAIVRNPQVFLLDEPLSNLDAQLRVETRINLQKLHRELGSTFIYVTHDQVEAMTMGDRIAVLNAGVIQQLGTPRDLYDTPANLFVAGFIGSPSMDFFNGKLVRTGDGQAAITIGSPEQSHTLPLRGKTNEVAAGQVTSDGRPVIAGIRPEHFELASDGDANTLTGTADVVEHLGNEQMVYVRLPGAVVPETVTTQGSVVRLPATAHVNPGDRITLTVNTEEMHLFDPETTNRLM